MKTPGVEVCNGKDDDCDGKVDELDSVSNRTTDDKLVYVAAQNVTMFVYEATRYDATGHRPRLRLDPPPLLRRRQAALDERHEGRGRGGLREDSAPAGASARSPSGSTPATGSATRPSRTATPTPAPTCNGYDYTQPKPPATIATGAADDVRLGSSTAAGDELYDMSGNVKEWVITGAASRQRRRTGPRSSCAAAPTTSPASSTTR